MILHGLKNCDTCRKVMKTLDAADISYLFKDIREDGVTKKELTRWAKTAGWEKLLNTRSTTWRSLSKADKDDMTEAKAISLMDTHPTLIKRPVITRGDTEVYIGWNAATEKTLIAS